MHSQQSIIQNQKARVHSEIGSLCLILLLTVLLRFPTLLEPWGGDQGVYGFIADGMLHGKVPYRDMYTMTGYGVYFAYALFFKLFGNHMIALHIGDLFVSLTTVVLVYFLTRLLYGRECGIIAGIISSLFGSGRSFSYMVDMQGAWGTYWQLSQRETFMTPLLAAGVLLAILGDRKNKWHFCFWAGIMLGLAAIFKITAVLMLFIFLFFIVLSGFNRRGDGSLKRSLYKTIGIITGFIVIQLPFLFYFWHQHSLTEMYQAVFVHTAIYAGLSRGNIVANAFEGNTYIMSENLFLWLTTFASCIYLMAHRRSRESYLLVAWTVGTLAMVWGQGKFFGYHFLLIVAPFSVLTGFGIQRFMKTMPSWKESWIAARTDLLQIFLWVLLFTNLSAFVWSHYPYYKWNIQYLAGKLSRSEYLEVFNEYPLHLYSFRSDNEVAHYLREHARPGATFRAINGGGEMVINYLSGLQPATKFTSTWYLFHKGLYHNPLTATLRREFLEGIRKEKPDYLLLVYFTMEKFRKEYPAQEFQDVGKLMDYIQSHYTRVKSFRDGRSLYMRTGEERLLGMDRLLKIPGFEVATRSLFLGNSHVFYRHGG